MIQMEESLMYHFKSEIYKFSNTYVIKSTLILGVNNHKPRLPM